jgi:phosphoglycerate dehydrogenase-like enzyme
LERPTLTKIAVSIPFRNDQFRTLTETYPDIEFARCELETLKDHIAGAEAAVTWRLPAEAQDAADKLVWIQGGGAGMESYLNESFRARNFVLTNASGVSAPNMAEHTIAMILAFARGIPRHVLANQKKVWRDETIESNDFELTDQVAFVVGTGAIGTEIAKRLRAFGTRIVGVRRDGSKDAGRHFDETIGFADLTTRLGEADHVISSLPLTPDSSGLFDEAVFGAFKPGSYFYNVGRGGTVDQGALIAALERGHLAGAGLDVVTPEPLPADHPLWDAKNVLITSHQSGGSNRTLDRLFELTVDNIRRWSAGDELRNLVDQSAGY